jgi:hypothetical protein
MVATVMVRTSIQQKDETMTVAAQPKLRPGFESSEETVAGRIPHPRHRPLHTQLKVPRPAVSFARPSRLDGLYGVHPDPFVVG